MKRVLLRFFADINAGDDLMVFELLRRYPDWDFYAYGRDRLSLTPFLTHQNFHTMERGYLTAALSHDRYDVYLLLGGSVLNYNCLSGLFDQGKEVLLCTLLRLKGAKTAVIGANLALPKQSFVRRAVVLPLWVRMRGLDLITVRDLDSYRSLERFVSGRIRYFPDIVLGSPLPETGGHTGAPPKTLGISVLRAMGRGGRTLAVCQSIAALADAFLRETGERVILFAFDTGTANDSHAVLQIYRLIQQKDRVEPFFYSGDRERLLEKIRRCDFMLPLRFHACVLSMMLRVPILPLIYAGKTAQLLRDLHYSGLSFGLEDLRLESTWRQIFERVSRAEGFTLSEEQLASLHKAAQGHFAQLETLFSAQAPQESEKEKHAVGS